MNTYVPTGVGAGNVGFTLLIESLPITSRGKYLALASGCWSVGTIFINVLAWLIIGHGFSWRLLTLAGKITGVKGYISLYWWCLVSCGVVH